MCLHPVFGPAKSHKQQVLRQLCIDWVTSTAQWVTCSLVYWKQRKFMFITELTFRHQQGCQITSTISPITKSQCALRDSPGSSHYPRSKIATDPNCSFMLIRLFIKMPKRMRTGWVWNSGANCNGRLAVNCQAIAKGSDMRWFVYLCIIFPVKDWHRKKNLAMNKWIRKTLRYFSCGCFCMNSKSRTTVAMC